MPIIIRGKIMTANENDERALRLLVKDAEFKTDKVNNFVCIVPCEISAFIFELATLWLTLAENSFFNSVIYYITKN